MGKELKAGLQLIYFIPFVPAIGIMNSQIESYQY